MKFLFRFLVLFVIFGSNPECYGSVISDSIDLIDRDRERLIPILIYKDEERINKDLPVVIIGHGYGAKNSEYSFIAKPLAEHGYFVVSIQHDLKGDDPLPREGDLFRRRWPLWERGSQNIMFTISRLKKRYPDLNLSHVILVGHSNGGDISMFFSEEYPDLVEKIISFDSLRYPYSKTIPILHFSATDTKPDFGVVPIYDVHCKNIFIDGAKHMDFHDGGDFIVQNRAVVEVLEFLKS